MKKPHKHAELIKAWADGAEIEYRCYEDERWFATQHPEWTESCFYRLKPEQKPDVVLYALINRGGVSAYSEFKTPADNVQLTFDGQTRKLKSVEIL